MKTININISNFASSMGYCQLILTNIYHLGLKRDISPQMQRGKEIHANLQAEDALIPRQRATEEQLQDHKVDIDFAREGISLAIHRKHSTGITFVYIGRTDRVFRKGGNIIISDDKISFSPKRTFIPSTDKILQLAAYCEAFSHNYSHMLSYNKMIMEIVQRDENGKIIGGFLREYDQRMKNFLFDNFERFEAMHLKIAEPQHHQNPNKCRACGFLKCPKRLGSRMDE